MEKQGISKLDLKRRNRMQVLKTLKQRGASSRIDIANELSLTRAAVTIITNEMIEQGIINELGEQKKNLTEKATRGRKKIFIDINHHHKFVFGITVEEHIVSVGLATLGGDVLDKHNMQIDENTTKAEIFSFIESAVCNIMDLNCLIKTHLLGFGIGIFPTMYSRLDIQVEEKIPDYSSIYEYLRRITDLPIIFDNSVKGLAMANIDFLKNPDPKRKNIAFLQYGDTMHFVVTNLNEPIRLYDYRTGFVDKIIVNPTTKRKCNCGRNGCVENEITPHAIERKVKEIYSEKKTPILFHETCGDVEKVTLDTIYSAYLQNDIKVIEVVEDTLQLVAVLINNLYFSTNPQKIVLHQFKIGCLDNTFFNIIKNYVTIIGGARVSSKLVLSIIEDEHHFLGGCALAVRQLFYDKGGMD